MLSRPAIAGNASPKETPSREAARSPKPGAAPTPEACSSNQLLREAVRMLNSAGRLATATQLALRSSSASLRPAENLLRASAISLGSAANCLLASADYLCSLSNENFSPLPGLFFALRRAAKWVCVGATTMRSHWTPLSNSMRETAISLALAAAAYEEGAANEILKRQQQNAEETRSRSPHRREEASEDASSSNDSRRRSTRHASRSSARERLARPERNTTDEEQDNMKFSHILIKHKDSRRPMDYHKAPVTRTKDEAMKIVIAIHEKITKELITFADAAVVYSECPTAPNGGDLECSPKKRAMKRSLDQSNISLAPDELSEILESQSGFHIVHRRE